MTIKNIIQFFEWYQHSSGVQHDGNDDDEIYIKNGKEFYKINDIYGSKINNKTVVVIGV